MFIINSFVKLGEEECKTCYLHEKNLQDCYRLSKAEFCEISVDGARHTRAATEARSLYRKEKERKLAEYEVAMSVDMPKVIMLS